MCCCLCKCANVEFSCCIRRSGREIKTHHDPEIRQNHQRSTASSMKKSGRRPQCSKTSTKFNQATTLHLQNQPKFSSASIRSFSTSLNSRLRSQALFGWTPSPGTAFYAGYNDDLNYDSPHPFTTQLVPGFRRNSRTFFIKASYLIRKGF